MRRTVSVLLMLISLISLSSCAFVGDDPISPREEDAVYGFVSGFGHGLLAPYSLLARQVADVGMYATPNNGFMYDAGFLIGVFFAISPVGFFALVGAVVLLLL